MSADWHGKALRGQSGNVTVDPMNTHDALRLAWVRGICSSGAARSIRVANGLSLREVACSLVDPDDPGDPPAALPVSATTIFRWEGGQARPTGARALAYAHLLEQLTRPRSRVS